MSDVLRNQLIKIEAFTSQFTDLYFLTCMNKERCENYALI